MELWVNQDWLKASVTDHVIIGQGIAEAYELLSEIYMKVSKTYTNPLYTGGLFHCYMLDESICHFRSGRFCQFYSISDGKFHKQTM